MAFFTPDDCGRDLFHVGIVDPYRAAFCRSFSIFILVNKITIKKF